MPESKIELVHAPRSILPLVKVVNGVGPIEGRIFSISTVGQLSKLLYFNLFFRKLLAINIINM